VCVCVCVGGGLGCTQTNRVRQLIEACLAVSLHALRQVVEEESRLHPETKQRQRRGGRGGERRWWWHSAVRGGRLSAAWMSRATPLPRTRRFDRLTYVDAPPVPLPGPHPRPAPPRRTRTHMQMLWQHKADLWRCSGTPLASVTQPP